MKILMKSFTSALKTQMKNEMLLKRNRGWSNARIAKALGCHVNTVIKYIGVEPAKITARTMKKAGKARAAANLQRNFQTYHKLNEFKSTGTIEEAKLRTTILEATAKLEQLHEELASNDKALVAVKRRIAKSA